MFRAVFKFGEKTVCEVELFVFAVAGGGGASRAAPEDQTRGGDR